MRKAGYGLVVIVVVALVAMGCGGPGGTSGTAESSGTDGSGEPSATTGTGGTGGTGGDGWTTAATVNADDPPAAVGVKVSEPFTAKGDVRFVLNMPDGGATAVIAGNIVPADQAKDSSTLIDALKTAKQAVLTSAKDTVVVSGLDGTYVFVLSPSSLKGWSVEIQTGP